MKSSGIMKLVLDVLKPHDPTLPEFALQLKKTPGVKSVTISLVEMNERTESLKVVLEGLDIDFDSVKRNLNRWGAAIHSVDEVVVGEA